MLCLQDTLNNNSTRATSSPLKVFSAALAFSSILLFAPLRPLPTSPATPRASSQFANREKLSLKKMELSLKLNAPAMAIKATIEKTKRRFDY
ncbi:unnamed protein product [Linum tenue]|uniref:Uncharacterized protein n=1 Tax=Linum tenue TaxID=586396 RepID=A0AAV0GV72_9ROSI|nr:unnamed protein product [Linum tenue]